MSLLERCKNGNESAWRALCADQAARVFRWAVFLGLEPADAEDAAQEVLLVAVRQIERCHGDRELVAWLFGITRRVVSNRRRNAWLRRWTGASQAAEDALAFSHEKPLGKVDELAVRRCLRRLSRAHSEVLVMIEVVGLTRDECAKVLGKPAGTVASRLRRARAAFTALWNEDQHSTAAVAPAEQAR